MKKFIEKNALLFLLVFGLTQMFADVCGFSILKAIAAATAASPAPKVFSVANGLETYSTIFYIEWQDKSGKENSIQLTSETNARLKGPYNRRNIYGAAISYGPALAVNPRTKPMLDQVMRYALCDKAPLLKELGVNTAEISGLVKVRFEPKQNPNNLPLVMEAPCLR